MLESAVQQYWRASKTLANWRGTLVGADPKFAAIVVSDHLRFTRAVRPVIGQTSRRAAAAVEWLFKAHDATGDGVSYGYFPVSDCRGWDISYPETTGYIITSLIQYARRTKWSEPIDRAHRMAQWEAEIQLPSGAVQGGKLMVRNKRTPATFNTGMVLDGFITLLEERSDPVVFRAAELAAEFLCLDMNDQGLFRTNGEFVSGGTIKIYNVLCAWALNRFGCLTGITRYCDVAVKAVAGALRFQHENGWFAHSCLSDSNRPLTHTIGYTAQGILEVGIAAGREDFVAASERVWCALIPRISRNGFLPGRFNMSWHPTVRWSCLTGSAQLAVVGYRLSALRRNAQYAQAADRLVNFLKAVQRMESGMPEIDGALAGAFPIMGDYMPAGYPNWATKYLLDALMLQADCSGDQLIPQN